MVSPGEDGDVISGVALDGTSVEADVQLGAHALNPHIRAEVATSSSYPASKPTNSST